MGTFRRFHRRRVSRKQFLIGGAGGVGLVAAWPIVKSRAFRLQSDGIREAVADRDDDQRRLDATFITDELRRYIPDAELTEHDTAQIFENPNGSFMIDDVRGTACLVAVNHADATVALVALLPHDAKITNVMPVLAKTIIDVSDRHPNAASYGGYFVVHDFRKASIAQRLFPGSTISDVGGGDWRLTVPRFSDAVEEVRSWL